MKRQVAHTALAVAAFGLISSSFAAPAKADTASDIAALKARLKQLESQVAEQKKDAKQAKNANNSAKVAANDPKAPPPVFVDLRKGLFVETEDKQYAFKIGGRVFVDGGGIAGPSGNGFQGNAGFGQVRLEAEGKAKSWFYKIQYDFANGTTQLWNTNLSNAALGGTNITGTTSGNSLATARVNSYVTDRNFLWGGFRDVFMGLQDERLSHPLLAQPVYFKIGNQFEGFSMEATQSSKYREFIERPQVVDVIAPARHIGASAGFIGKDNWTGHFGVYTVSPQDLNMRPVNTSSGTGPGYAVSYAGNGASGNWYQPYGGGAYWETTGRITYAPIFDEHRLVHIAAAGSFHQANSSTAYTDDRNLAPGNRLNSEANILGTGFLGTTDLSCGRFNEPYGLGGSTASAAGGCVKNIEKVGVEFYGAWHNLWVGGEWMMANYNRNTYASQQFSALQAANYGTGPIIAPLQGNYQTKGGYLQGEWYITGEEKAQSYDQTDKNGANFAQIKIKDKFSDGGWGAWGLAGRWSVINLNNGPYQGQQLFNNLLLANAANTLAGRGSGASNTALFNMQNVVANSGIYGGYQSNVTGGVNWYPDNGVQFQFNATKVLSLKSPLNWNPQATYESGYHPTLLEMRTKIYF